MEEHGRSQLMIEKNLEKSWKSSLLWLNDHSNFTKCNNQRARVLAVLFIRNCFFFATKQIIGAIVEDVFSVGIQRKTRYFTIKYTLLKLQWDTHF